MRRVVGRHGRSQAGQVLLDVGQQPLLDHSLDANRGTAKEAKRRGPRRTASIRSPFARSRASTSLIPSRTLSAACSALVGSMSAMVTSGRGWPATILWTQSALAP